MLLGVLLRANLSLGRPRPLVTKKYECASCTELFYTEEEREAHCKKKGHFHTFGMRVSSYCELYVNQFLKDIEHIATYGIDAVVMQRSKSNLACDSALNKLPRKGNTVKRKRSVSPSHTQPSSSSKTCVANASSSVDASTSVDKDKEDTSVVPSASNSSTSASQKQAKGSRNRSRIPSDDWMRIEVDNTSAISPATQILSEALRTNAPEVRCMICKAMTPSEYVLRKHHVSSVHMPKDHTESDYVEILSALMQKAYPTLTYNDLQCQIGGCRKEYKCQSARRTHVLRIHFQNELSCPLKLCSFRSNDFPRINTHLKEDHGLPNGYLSIESSATRDQFNADRAKHNHRLTTLVQLAFPCPIPESCKSGFRTSEANSPGETINSLITKIREKDRKFQTVPPNPLRLRSPSSSSDSDSTEPEKVTKSPVKKTSETTKRVNGCSSKTSTPSKTKQIEPKSSPEGIHASRSSSSSSSSSSESDEEQVVAKENKPLTPKKQENHPLENGSVAKRKKVRPTVNTLDSSSSSSTSSDSDNDGSKSGWSLCSNVSQASNTPKIVKGRDNEVPGSDVDSMWNNASEKSDSSSESGDEVQLVACIPTRPARSTIKEITIDEVVLDDDEDDAVAAPSASTSSKASTPPPKQPTIRTLSISGVSVRTDVEHTTPEKSVRTLSERAFSRTLPISGVSVRADGTPIRPHSDTYRKSFPGVGHFIPQRHQSNSSEQLERRRELARRKFDLAEQKRAQFKGRKNRNALSKRPGTAASVTYFQNGKKVKTPSKSPHKRSKSAGDRVRTPSYTVPKVKREMATPLKTPRAGNSWQGKIKRFED
ncbi:hypothetical protein Y032_0001g88 [Ancylostoma ceylanicum]|uniref:C2H2-type domain-containing protein n=1 Tax=Ancylostoma ceylanicum TaxID=53326 RepID=A0A016W6P5_9BILA|nr:hypothetical protein Y032_0001g88 [Ancylostoma ceylanicum]